MGKGGMLLFEMRGWQILSENGIAIFQDKSSKSCRFGKCE